MNTHTNKSETLTQALASRGYSHARNKHSERTGRHDITRNSRRVAVLSAGECWEWLKRWDRKVAAMRLKGAS